MTKNIIKGLSIVTASLLITACNNSSSNNNNVTAEDKVDNTEVTYKTYTFVDDVVSGINAVCVSGITNPSVQTSNSQGSFSMDSRCSTIAIGIFPAVSTPIFKPIILNTIISNTTKYVSTTGVTLGQFNTNEVTQKEGDTDNILVTTFDIVEKPNGQSMEEYIENSKKRT